MYKHIYMYIYTHTHKTRAAAAASILCPRPQLTVLRFYSLTIGVLDNVIHTISRFFYYHIVQALPKRLLLVIQSSPNYYSLKLQQNSMRAFFFFTSRFLSRSRVFPLFSVSRNGHCVFFIRASPPLMLSYLFPRLSWCHRIYSSAWTDLSRGDLPNDSRQSMKKHTFRNLYVFFSPRARY